MSGILTIRIDPARRAKLKRSAQAAGKNESQFVRDLIARELDAKPLGDRIRRLRGSIALPRKSSDAWRRALRARNWR